MATYPLATCAPGAEVCLLWNDDEQGTCSFPFHAPPREVCGG